MITGTICMKKYSIFILVVLWNVACTPKIITEPQGEIPCIDQTKINREANCPYIWKPVCGCDKKTYSNDCEAMKAGVTKWSPGACVEVM